jgi:hypothetical protein
MTLIVLIVLAALIPWSWTKWLWQRVLSFFWKRSTLKMGVEIGGRKVASFKDEHLTKKNAPKVE